MFLSNVPENRHPFLSRKLKIIAVERKALWAFSVSSVPLICSKPLFPRTNHKGVSLEVRDIFKHKGDEKKEKYQLGDTV